MLSDQRGIAEKCYIFVWFIESHFNKTTANELDYPIMDNQKPHRVEAYEDLL